VHLGRFVDKIRLQAKGQLPADYQGNFTKGFDGKWLEASGVDKEAFIEMVRGAKNDAEVEQWVVKNVNNRKTPKEIEAFNQSVLQHGRQPELQERMRQRKAESGLSGRDDIQTFVDFIDADEGRL
jgi:hypothetical protein